MLLSIHIAAGGVAIVLGAVALLVKKGGTIHRRSGLLFVYSMLVLGATAALGFRKSPADGNVFGGLMTVYFVGTALTTVRPVPAWTRRSNFAALTVAVGLALVDIAGGVKAFNSSRVLLNGVPFVMHFFIAGVMILATTGDVRIMRFGVPRGICGECASRCSSRPDHFSRSVSAWQKFFPSHSRQRRCARCRSSWCSARCSIGCGGSAAARCRCSSNTIRCHSPLAQSDFLRNSVIAAGSLLLRAMAVRNPNSSKPG